MNFMKNYRKVCLHVVFLSIFLTGCMDEEQKNYYATYDEAIQDSAIQRGLIPQNLPSSSKEIHERHFIDADLVWVRFTAHADDFSILLHTLTELTLEDVRSLGYQMSATPEDWPDMLSKKHLKRVTHDFPVVVARYDYLIEYGHKKVVSQYGYFFLDFAAHEGFYFGGTTLKIGTPKEDTADKRQQAHH